MKIWMAMAAALALGVSAGAANAADKLKACWVYVGPVGDFGYSYQHDQGRKAVEKALGDKVETAFLENVAEGPDAERAIERLAREGCKIIFTTSFGFMDPTIKVAAKYPDVKFEHATGYKKADNVGDLQRALLRRPLRDGPDRRQDVEDRHGRLHRVLPDPGSRHGHQRLHARRPVGEPGLQGQDRLGELLVSIPARKPTPPRCCSARVPTSSSSTPTRPRRCRWPRSAASSASASPPT